MHCVTQTARFDALLGDVDFSALSARFGQFCPFEAMGVVRAEIRHGNALAYLLDPKRPHGFAAAMLEAFLTAVTSADTASLLVQADGRDVQIRREWQNIDLLIILPNSRMIVTVELKIDASQGHDQLSRYRKVVEAQWPLTDGWQHKFVFLTKREEAARDNWQGLRLGPVIAEFERALSKFGSAPASDFVREYIDMLRRHHVGDSASKERARKLWAEHGEALAYLMQHRPDPIRNLFNALKTAAVEIAAAASTATMSVVEDAHTASILRFAIKEWDQIPGFRDGERWTNSKRMILIEMKFEDSGLGAYAHIGPSSAKSRTTFVTSLLAKNAITRQAAQAGGWAKLAELELFRPNDPLQFDIDDAIASVTADFCAFVARVHRDFDTALVARATPMSGSDTTERHAI